MVQPILVFAWAIKLFMVLYLSYKHWLSRLAKKHDQNIPESQILNKFPKILIQLPVYNEPENIIGLLDSVLSLEWPLEQLEIQLLDDSTDSTSEIASSFLKSRLSSFDFKISHIRRSNREGFKAGALNYGLELTTCDYICIFDADFRPKSNFLTKMMPYFQEDENIAAVQASWSYRNSYENLLTRLQKMFLNSHFHIEQKARFHRGLLFNFNGTAGIWNASVIRKVGGWKCNTVTEDLYLSYKVQMEGYKLVFVDEIEVSSELPSNFKSFCIQQNRWAKGNGQCLRLLWKEIWASKYLSFKQKFDMILHMFGYGLSSSLLMSSLLLPFVIFARYQFIQDTVYYSPLRIFDLLLWVSLIFSIIRLYSLKAVHYGENLSLTKRLAQAFTLLLSAPAIGWVPFKSFWSGLFYATSSQQKHKVFHRTPKRALSYKGSINQPKYWMVLIFLSFSTYAVLLEQFFVTIVLLMQLFFVMKVFSDESNNPSPKYRIGSESTLG